MPDPIDYRSDLWHEIGMKPDTWDDIRAGGRKIKEKTGIPVGIGLSSELDTAMAMWPSCIRSARMNGCRGHLSIKSKETLEAIKFVKALHQKPRLRSAWDPSSTIGRCWRENHRWSSTPFRSPRPRTTRCRSVRNAPAKAQGPRAPIGLEHVMVLCCLEVRG